jgi:ubiquitin carboxyl-terminal hydrolase 34
LLFHLKRFDYNLRTGQRSKLNDHFTFPDEIDMRPYKVEHLIDTPDQSPPDVFELVGILVHSGTAESGHYFSYIKERPSNTDQPRWVEFNDDLVSRWDPGFKEAKCFGGYDMASGNFQIEKQYSAYMLFYQRTSALRSQEQALARSGKTIPVRLPLIPRLHNHIEMENELLMRKHCLYDPSHSNFVNKMLSNIKNINKGRCSESHDLEKSALVTALNHLDQVVSRAKDTPDFVTAMLAIRQICHTCAECSRDFLEWFCDRPDALRNLLLRNPEALIRTEMASSILSALTKVKVEIPYAYGLSPEEDDGNDEIRLIHKVVETINILWDQFHSSCRAWPEYFGLLGSIAKLGEHEAAILMDFGFLRKVIEVMSADLNLSASNQYTRMLNIVSKRVATRPVSYDAVINLLYRLLKVCDLTVPPMHNNEERLELVMTDSPVPMTDFEMKLMLQHWVRGQIHILTEKLLQLNQNHYATTNILIILLQYMPSVDFNIYQAINHGIRKLTAHIPCAPFLRAAITYCEHSGEPDAIHKMITYVAKITAGLENMEGREFVQFFKDIIELPSNKNDLTKDDILKIVVDLIPTWAPGLLNYFDPTVRENTEIMLSEILFNTALELDSMNGEESEKATHITRIIQNLGVACLNHLQESYVVPSQQAVRFTLENMLRVIETCGSYFDEDDLDSHFAVRKLGMTSFSDFLRAVADTDTSCTSGLEKDYC